MIKVTKEINLSQLDSELNGKGLIASVDENKQINAVGLADNNDATEADLESAIKAHKAAPIAQLTIAEKLASVGLSVDDLKVALGI
jgi:predicted alpha/beta hydrolase